MSRQRELQVGLVLILFAVVSFIRHYGVRGSDLAPSYLGCRVLAAGDAGHLYAHDPILFNHVYDPAWTAAEIRSGMGADYNTPPYVQTPLWAWSLKPICTRMAFPRFARLFLALMLLCFAATLWLVARYWTPRLFHPAWIALICIGLYLTEAFQYSLSLVQTHIFFVLLMVAAMTLAAKKRGVWAGLLLAVAAAVKITPGLLLLYWLARRQWKAAASFGVASAAIVAITAAVAGPTVFMAYLTELSRTSNVLLVAFNNQSLAAWWMGHRYPASDLFVWNILRLPFGVKLISTLLSVASVVVGGWMDNGQPPGKTGGIRLSGAAFAMAGATIFAPIAWSHYSILLVVPVMILIDAHLQRSSNRRERWIFLALALAVFALNLYPLSYREVLMHPFTLRVLGNRPLSLVRSQFYAGLLAMAGMWLVTRWTRGAGREAAATQTA